MIVAVDTNVLLDVLLPDPRFVEASRAALTAAHSAGSLVLCDVVLSEIGSQFGSEDELKRFLATTGLTPAPMSLGACRDAGC